MRIADTSALYAAVVAEDAHHERARAALEDADPIVVPSEVFAETVALLQLRHGFPLASKTAKAMRHLPHLRVEGSPSGVIAAAWSEYEAAGGALSLLDAFVVAWCAKERAPPLTFDREIAKRAKRS
ncbi:MAG TPA: PIN domain-containing protein [Candidatus Thermoplasmatota archaeon]|nr:PIN domain-containing protein [Candidatus Thermoplasmatota archaeon]